MMVVAGSRQMVGRHVRSLHVGDIIGMIAMVVEVAVGVVILERHAEDHVRVGVRRGALVLELVDQAGRRCAGENDRERDAERHDSGLRKAGQRRFHEDMTTGACPAPQGG